MSQENICVKKPEETRAGNENRLRSLQWEDDGEGRRVEGGAVKQPEYMRWEARGARGAMGGASWVTGGWGDRNGRGWVRSAMSAKGKRRESRVERHNECQG